MHDLILRGGTVHDGLGSEPVTADVAVSGDRVAAVGRDLGAAQRVIDVTGLAVAPGFVDPHSHSDMVPLMAEPQPFKLLQGVTTEIAGNCGYSFAPLGEAAAAHGHDLLTDISAGQPVVARTFKEYLAEVAAAGPANNIGVLAGHNTLRLNVAGMEPGLPPGGLARMQGLLAEAFEAGAIGLSSGLIYPPGCYAGTGELVELAKVAHAYGLPYATHLRNEDRDLLAALGEAIEIGRRARVRVQISHCKAAGRAQHGSAGQLLAALRAARVSGVDIRGDVYPYLAGGTFLSALLPNEAHAGGVHALRSRLLDPAGRAALLAAATDPAAAAGTGFWREVGPGDVLVTSHANRPDAVGRTIALLAAEDAADPWDIACELIATDPSAGMVLTMMAEEDVRVLLADPLTSIGSDNGMPYGLQHPRTWGCFPHFLGEYVRELGLVSLPEAIRKMTSASAGQFGLTGRGWLGPGSVADIAVFDPATIGHPGTYLTPDTRPAGVHCVLLGGQVAVADGSFTGIRAGQVVGPLMSL
ncbi:N-acyl-D-amino-acid deacylase family protein [Longispora albida]|uniref:N-acyl-D-amino-acid deacylase family protein n=1 Tax=Longispora albida TaxID=203523 RepID=UPI0003637C12|nr:D-aminoacylase [Longispora albida]